MKPEWCPQWITDKAVRVYNSLGNSHVFNEDAIARALLDAHQRGKDENQAEIDRLNKVIARMQQTMSSQAEQWSRSMAEAKREGMEWQPIGTAPEDEAVLVCGGDVFYPCTASWSGLSDEEWALDAQAMCHDNIGWPTHWMPLPEPPSAIRAKAREVKL